MDSYDNRVTEVIGELTSTLGHPIPPRWGWADAVRIGRGSRNVPSDEGFVWGGKLFLANRMRGRLDPEEWRPILASSLVLKWRLEAGAKKKVLIRLVLPAFLVFAFSLALVLAYGLSSSTQPSTTQLLLISVNLVTLIALVLVPRLLYGSYYQEVKVIADRQAASLVGRQAFLDVLEKIDRMGLKDVERAKERHRWSPRVGIERRINNLQDYTQTA